MTVVPAIRVNKIYVLVYYNLMGILQSWIWTTKISLFKKKKRKEIFDLYMKM